MEWDTNQPLPPLSYKFYVNIDFSCVSLKEESKICISFRFRSTWNRARDWQSTFRREQRSTSHMHHSWESNANSEFQHFTTLFRSPEKSIPVEFHCHAIRIPNQIFQKERIRKSLRKCADCTPNCSHYTTCNYLGKSKLESPKNSRHKERPKFFIPYQQRQEIWEFLSYCCRETWGFFVSSRINPCSSWFSVRRPAFNKNKPPPSKFSKAIFAPGGNTFFTAGDHEILESRMRKREGLRSKTFGKVPVAQNVSNTFSTNIQRVEPGLWCKSSSCRGALFLQTEKKVLRSKVNIVLYYRICCYCYSVNFSPLNVSESFASFSLNFIHIWQMSDVASNIRTWTHFLKRKHILS